MDIKQIRKKLGMTQQQFAEAIGGASVRSVIRWEQGIEPMPLYQQAIDRLVASHTDLILGD